MYTLLVAATAVVDVVGAVVRAQLKVMLCTVHL